MSNLRLSRQHATQFAGFSAAIILALAGGCGGGDSEAMKKIQKAEQTIGALTADGTFATLADDYRKKQLDSLHSSMNDLAQNGPEGIRAAAASIAARAKAGIAALETKAAVAADRELDSRLFDLRSGLTTYTLQKSIAEANTGAGTQQLIKTLQTSLEENKKVADEARKAASRVQATVDELTTRQKAVAAQAATKRQEASSIASGMQSATATQGLEILKRSTAVQAEASALEQQAADLGTQLGLAQAELSRARGTAAALDAQTKQIQDDIAAAQTHLSEEQKLADTAGKAASAAAAAIKKTYDEFVAFRSGTLDSAHQKAITASQNAHDLAKQAMGKASSNPQSVASGNAGKLATASMQQNYADALVSQARAQDQIAGTLALLGSSQPPLPGAADYASAADAARKASDDALTQARDLYTAVRESISSISDEKLKARIAETSRILEVLSSKQGVKAAEPEAKPSSGDKGTPAAAAPDAEVAAVKKLINQIHDKERAGDQLSVVNDLVYFEDEAQRETAREAAVFTASLRSFDKVCRDKLGSSAAEAMGPMGMAMGKMLELEDERRDMTAADYTVTVQGDKATATEKSGTEHVFVKRDGKWMATLPAEAAGVMSQLPPGALKNVKAALDAMAADINSGKITTKEQIQTQLMAKLGGMGGGRRGGKPGAGGGGGGTDEPNK